MVKNFLQIVQFGSGVHPTSYPMGTGALSPEVKRPAREADHSPPASPEVKKMWTYTSTNPADREVRSVIPFLNAKNIRLAEIHRQLVEVYGEVVMNEGNVCKWCVCLMVEGQMCTIKRDPDARLSSPRI
jgi:hypothetical protein